jgi:hypothetical protein
MNTKYIIYIVIIILFISGINGFLFEEGFISISPSILSVFLDGLLLIVTIFSIKNIKQTRKLISIFVLFLLLTLITNILNPNELTATLYLNGLREFLPYFLFPIIYLNIFQSSLQDYFVKKINIFLYFFLIVQIPVSLYQFSINGAGDAVGGTLGEGASGILTFIVFLATYYLMTRDIDYKNIVKSFIKKIYLLIFWLPAFINETKISFFLIILFFLLLISFSFSNLIKYLLIGIVLIPALFLFDSIYNNITGNSYTNEILDKDFFESYLMSDEEHYTDIPRLQKIAIIFTTFKTEEIIFGKGVGQFKGGTTLSLTPFAAQNDWLLQGSRPMFFFLLVQIGVVGVILFCFYWVFLITLRRKKNQVNYSGNLIIYAFACFIIIQFYNDSLRSLFFCGIIMYIMCYAISQKKTTRTERNIVRTFNSSQIESGKTNFRNINI